MAASLIPSLRGAKRRSNPEPGKTWIASSQGLLAMTACSRRKAYAAGRDRRPGTARRMALDVHRHRVLRDVGRGDFDVNRETGGAAAEPLRPDAEFVHRARQFLFDFGAVFVGAHRT